MKHEKEGGGGGEEVDGASGEQVKQVDEKKKVENM